MSMKDDLKMLSPIAASLSAIAYSSLPSAEWGAAIDTAQLPIVAAGVAGTLWSGARIISKQDPASFSSSASLRLAAAAVLASGAIYLPFEFQETARNLAQGLGMHAHLAQWWQNGRDFLERLRQHISGNGLSWATVAGASFTDLMLLVFGWRDLIGIPMSRLQTRKKLNAIRARHGWMEATSVSRLVTDKGLPLGLYQGSVIRYSAGPGFLGGHHGVMAGSRAGKGVACVCPAMLDHCGPLVVVDIKGENFAVCSPYRRSLGRKQIVLNPFHLIKDESSFIEPMRYLRPGPNLQRDITVLADGLIKPIPQPNDWISQKARSIVEAALELVATQLPPKDQTLVTAYDLLTGPCKMAAFEAWTRAGNICNGRIASAGATILEMDSRERGIVFGYIDDSLKWLKHDQMKKLLSGASFSWDELLDGKVDIYIIIPQDMIEHLSGFMRLVMNMVLGCVTRQDGRRKVKDRILCVLDEFTRLGRMEKILEIATIAAGGGVEAVFIAQDLGALEETYGAAPTRTILGSCASLRIFGLGAGDERTAQWAESLLPSHEIVRWSETIDRSGNKTWTKHIDKAPLLGKAELLEIPATAMLCRFRANPGILLDQIISHRHPKYRNRLSENPVVRA